LHFIYNISEPFYREKYVLRCCTGRMEETSQSMIYSACHQKRRGVLQLYCLYYVSRSWFFAIQLHSHQDEYKNILVSEKQRIWMKPARPSPIFIEDSKVDVFYLNLCPLELNSDFIIVESEKTNVPKSYVLCVVDCLATKSLPDKQSV
jgi:hypothetical protein